MEIKVSVIIPFYNVEPFIGRCVRSLMEQTLREVEFLFVDDASPDGSSEIVRKVTAEYDRSVRILTHSRNRGLPAARNTGLSEAKGEYIYHCDSDDYMEPSLLEDLYGAAQAAEADYAYCDFFLDFGTSRRQMVNPTYERPEQMIKEGFLAGLMKYNVWNKLVRRSLYEQTPLLRFPEGYSMGEDMTMIILATRATRTVHIPVPLYHYMKTNAAAFTNTFSERHLAEIRFNADRTLKVIGEWPVADKERYMAFFQLNIKLPFLLSGSYRQYRLWHSWFPQANRFIPQNTHLPRRTRMVQQWAAWHLFPLVWLYGFSVNHLYYRLLHRDK